MSEEKNTDLIPHPELQLHEEEAQRTIRNYTIAASGGGLIPHPVLNVGATAGVQVLMIRDLCKLYNVPFNEKLVGVVINSTVGSIISKLATLAVMLIPGRKFLLRGLSAVGVVGVYTATVGEFYKVHFQKGGTLEDASIWDLNKYIRQEIKNGEISMKDVTNPITIVKRFFK